jgi:hypothetical protein
MDRRDAVLIYAEIVDADHHRLRITIKSHRDPRKSTAIIEKLERLMYWVTLFSLPSNELFSPAGLCDVEEASIASFLRDRDHLLDLAAEQLDFSVSVLKRYRHKSTGEFIDATVRADGTVHYCRSGGGLAKRMLVDQLDQSYEDINGPFPLRRGRVSSSVISYRMKEGPNYFPCYATQEPRAKYGRPLFDLGVVLQMAEATEGLLRHDLQTGAVLCTYENGETETFLSVIRFLNGAAVLLYPIGNRDWAWSRVEFDSDDMTS